MPPPFCSNLRHCLSSRFQCLSLHLFSSPLHCYAPPIHAAAVLVPSLLCRRGSERIISFQHDSFSGRRHSVPWLIISFLCLRKATQCRSWPFQICAIPCLVHSGHVYAAAVLLSAILRFALAMQFTSLSFPSPLLAILCSSSSLLFIAFSIHLPSMPFPCITDRCFASSNQLPSTPFLFHCITSHLLSIPSQRISVLIHAAASLRCRRAS